MNSSTQPQPVSFQQILILHLILGIGVLIFAMVVVVLSFNASAMSPTDNTLFLLMAYLCLFLGLILPYVSEFIFSRLIQKHKANYPDAETNRYAIFLQAHLIRMALLEAMALFSLTMLLIRVLEVGSLDYTTETLFPAFVVFLFFYYWFRHFPSEDKIRSAIGL